MKDHIAGLEITLKTTILITFGLLFILLEQLLEELSELDMDFCAKCLHTCTQLQNNNV